MAREKKKNNNQVVLFLLSIVIFLVVIMLVIFACYSYINKNNSSTKTVTNTVTMNYTAQTNGISVSNNSIFTDEVGKTLVNDSNVFDFVINSNVKSGKVHYEIVATKDDSSTIPDDKVRIYLQKSLDSNFLNSEDLLLPTSYLLSDNLTVSKDKGMLLGREKVSKQETIYYRLRVWVDSSYVPVTNNDTFKIIINVYAR